MFLRHQCSPQCISAEFNHCWVLVGKESHHTVHLFIRDTNTDNTELSPTSSYIKDVSWMLSMHCNQMFLMQPGRWGSRHAAINFWFLPPHTKHFASRSNNMRSVNSDFLGVTPSTLASPTYVYVKVYNRLNSFISKKYSCKFTRCPPI